MEKRFKGFNISLEHYYSAKDLLYALQVLPEKTLLLSDYELLGEETNGIDCIKRLNAFQHSLLITARADEQSIINSCTDNGIKILPKSLANDIEVFYKKPSSQVVLIDDDRLTHYSWKIAAKNCGISFTSFFSVQDFLNNSHNLSLDTAVYVDSDLGEGLRGEILSERISQLGFSELYLATSFSKSDFVKPVWIKDILGKQPPFEKDVGNNMHKKEITL